MKWFAGLVLALALLTGCQTNAPTPMIMGYLVEQSDEVNALYLACSQGANYVPSKEGCAPELLSTKIDSTREYAKLLISGDIKQTPGYDIYLTTSLKYFRIAQRTTNEYTIAERMARQFFEIQKAHSGRSLAPARFYWAAIGSGHASWQWFNDRLALSAPGITDPDVSRKTELLLIAVEGRHGLTDTRWLDGFRRVRLESYIDTLTKITDKIDG